MVSTGNNSMGGTITPNFTFTGSKTVSFSNIPGTVMPHKRYDTCKIYMLGSISSSSATQLFHRNSLIQVQQKFQDYLSWIR
jgi:hypothetical protein